VNETSWDRQAGDLRVSDDDRDAALSGLSDHFQAGRITTAELDERVGRALTARTGQDLAELFTDLPAGAVVRSQPAAPARSGRGIGLTRVGAIAVLAAVAVLAVAAGAHSYRYGGWAPWWLIPVMFFLLRRAAWSSRRRTRMNRGN
jgi:hypothetical protein